MLQILCRAERFAVTNPRVLIHSLSNARRATLRLLFFAEREGFFLRFAAKALRGYEPEGSHPLSF